MNRLDFLHDSDNLDNKPEPKKVCGGGQLNKRFQRYFKSTQQVLSGLEILLHAIQNGFCM